MMIKSKLKMVKKKEKGFVCKYCNSNNPLLETIDHRIPKTRGGTDDDSNKDEVCFVCNQLKGPLTDIEFRQYMKALNILKKLKKVTLLLQIPNVKFNQNFYPDWKYKPNSTPNISQNQKSPLPKPKSEVLKK